MGLRFVFVAAAILLSASMHVAALTVIPPNHARSHFGTFADTPSSTSDTPLNGVQAQHVYIKLMDAIVNANMTALADICDDNMTFIVVGWAPNDQRSPDACWKRGKDAFVKHVQGFVTLFNLSVAWIDRSTASYDTVFVQVGFSFVGGPKHSLVVAPQTMQMLTIVQNEKKEWKIGNFLEIGSWHNSTRDELMLNTWEQIGEAYSNGNISVFKQLLAQNASVSPYIAGSTSAAGPYNRTQFIDFLSARFATQAYASVVISNLFASCRFAWAVATIPWIDVTGKPHVKRFMAILEFEYDALSNGTPLISNWWEGLEYIPGNPFPVPPRMPDPKNN